MLRTCLMNRLVGVPSPRRERRCRRRREPLNRSKTCTRGWTSPSLLQPNQQPRSITAKRSQLTKPSVCLLVASLRRNELTVPMNCCHRRTRVCRGSTVAATALTRVDAVYVDAQVARAPAPHSASSPLPPSPLRPGLAASRPPCWSRPGTEEIRRRKVRRS